MMPDSTDSPHAAFFKDEIDEIIKSVFWHVQDETLFVFFKMQISIIEALYTKYKEVSLNELLFQSTSIEYTSFIDKEHVKILAAFKTKFPDYVNPNMLIHIMQFRLALQDRLMYYQNLSLKTKHECYLSLKIAILKDIEMKQDRGYAEWLQPQLNHIEIQIAECIRRTETELKLPQTNLVYFIRDRNFSDKALSDIAEYLFFRRIIRDKRAFIDFLSSKNVLVEINYDKILYYFELFRLLKKKQMITLNKGNKFISHIALHILDFSEKSQKSKTSQYLSNFARKNPPNKEIIEEIRNSIESKLK